MSQPRQIAAPKPASTTPLRIELPVVKGWGVLILSFLLIFWARGEYVGIEKLFLSPELPGKQPFDMPYFTKWCIFTVLGLPLCEAWLWNVFGHEFAEISGQSLIIRKQIGPIGFSHVFDQRDIREIRVNPKAWSGFWQGFGLGGTLEFAYRDNLYWFGLLLDENQACQIVESMQARMPNLECNETDNSPD